MTSESYQSLPPTGYTVAGYTAVVDYTSKNSAFFFAGKKGLVKKQSVFYCVDAGTNHEFSVATWEDIVHLYKELTRIFEARDRIFFQDEDYTDPPNLKICCCTEIENLFMDLLLQAHSDNPSQFEFYDSKKEKNMPMRDILECIHKEVTAS